MIFIGYRIADSYETVDRLDADLARAFGRDTVFRDRKRLQGGDQWPAVLEHNTANCRVMLVVIGPKWQSASYADDDRAGVLRLHDPEDWVRREVTLALDHGRTVIPVLLNNQKLPSRGWLARCGLGRLADCRGEKLRVDDYDTDLEKLVARLEQFCDRVRPDARTGGAAGRAHPLGAGRRG